MEIATDLLTEIVNRVLSVTRPERVILFGSAATGSMDEDSDIDLLVLESSATEPRRESVRVRDALRGLDFPFDVIVMDAQRFEETKDTVGSIAYPANKHGRVIYNAA